MSKNLGTLFFATIFFLGVSCGKKTEEDKKGLETIKNPILTEGELLLEKQELICEGEGRICPSYLTKVAIVVDNKTLKFCTGFLTDQNTVAMSSSCLPTFLRAEGQPCEGEMYFFFAREAAKPIKVGCKQVLRVSQLESNNPKLWRHNVAYVELGDHEFIRNRLLINRDGMKDSETLTIWSIDQGKDNTHGFIRKSVCYSVHNSVFNPLASDIYSPGMVIAGCDYKAGNEGSPIVDVWGRLRGMVSRPADASEMDDAIRTGVPVGALDSIIHATNFACAPDLEGTQVASSIECEKDLNDLSIDRARRELGDFSPLIKKIEQDINELATNPHLKLVVETSGDLHQPRVQYRPKCFKNFLSWTNTPIGGKKYHTDFIELPVLKLKRVIDRAGRLSVSEIGTDFANYTFGFYPRVLRSLKMATVFVTINGVNSPDFTDVPSSCSLLF